MFQFLKSVLLFKLLVFTVLSTVEVCLAQDSKEFRRVPDLKGLRPTIAKQIARLGKLNFRQGVFYIAPHNWRNDIRPSVIYMQSPQQKLPLRQNGLVVGWTFVKAKSSQRIISTPDLSGLKIAEANEKLGGNESILLVDCESDAVKETGSIREQYPRAGQKVYEGTTIFVRVQ